MKRNPESVVEELACLKKQGYNDFHLCDTEFNQDIEFCHQLLDLMIAKELKINWTLYLKTSPVDRELFRKLTSTGVSLITLSVPSSRGDYLEQTEKICSYSHDNSIRLAIDYLCGFPGQSLDSIKTDISAFSRILPDTVGLNSSLRLYPGIKIAEQIWKSETERRYLYGELENNDFLLKPLFYRRVTEKELTEFAAGDPLFKLEGTQHTSNYQRV